MAEAFAQPQLQMVPPPQQQAPLPQQQQQAPQQQAPPQQQQEGEVKVAAPTALTEAEKKALEELAPEISPLNDREKKTLEIIQTELKEELKTAVLHAHMLTRFIRGYAKEPDPDRKAVEMLRETLKWRKEQNVDSILDVKLEKEDLFAQMWPAIIQGHDKLGHPLYIERVGAVEPSEIEKNFGLDMMQRFHIKTMERLTREKDRVSRETGKTIYKHVAIVDMQGFGTKHMGQKFTGPMKAMVNIDQFYYPETLYKLIVVNVPFVFKILWKLVSPWIHPLTRERIKVGDEYLKEYVDEDQLPEFLRGK